MFVQPRPEWKVHDVEKFFKASDQPEDPSLVDIDFTIEDIEAALPVQS